ARQPRRRPPHRRSLARHCPYRSRSPAGCFERMNILVLSTYDITPVRDGGQTRYCNIYRHVAEQHSVTVLAYDVRRRTGRVYFLGERFKVVAPRYAEPDRRRFAALSERTERHLHDLLCIREYQFSREFYDALRREAACA